GLLDAVAEHPVLHALAERADDGLRRAEVHVGHPERKHVWEIRVPLAALCPAPFDDAIEVVDHAALTPARSAAGAGPPSPCGPACPRSRRSARRWGRRAHSPGGSGAGT